MKSVTSKIAFSLGLFLNSYSFSMDENCRKQFLEFIKNFNGFSVSELSGISESRVETDLGRWAHFLSGQPRSKKISHFSAEELGVIETKIAKPYNSLIETQYNNESNDVLTSNSIIDGVSWLLSGRDVFYKIRNIQGSRSQSLKEIVFTADTDWLLGHLVHTFNKQLIQMSANADSVEVVFNPFLHQLNGNGASYFDSNRGVLYVSPFDLLESLVPTEQKEVNGIKPFVGLWQGISEAFVYVRQHYRRYSNLMDISYSAIQSGEDGILKIQGQGKVADFLGKTVEIKLASNVAANYISQVEQNSAAKELDLYLDKLSLLSRQYLQQIKNKIPVYKTMMTLSRTDLFVPDSRRGLMFTVFLEPSTNPHNSNSLPVLQLRRKVYKEDLGQEVDVGFFRLEIVENELRPFMRITYATPEIDGGKRLEYSFGDYDGIWDSDVAALIKSLQAKEEIVDNDIIYSVQLTRKIWESIIPLRKYKDDIDSDLVYYLERQAFIATDLLSAIEALKNGRASQMGVEKQIDSFVKIDKLTTQLLRFDTPPDGTPFRKRLP